MGERVYVVRRGKTRGEGQYYYDGTFGSNARLAARLDHEAATRLVRTWPGRVVRLVTLSEQLRRERARSNRLGDLVCASGCGSVSDCQCPCHGPEEDPGPHIATCAYHDPNFEPDQRSAYARGRADERAAVVGWLRAMNDSYSAASPVLVHNRCEAIESGEHVKGGG